MPVCPNCHAEYRDGYTVCGDCGTALIPDSPTADQRNSGKGKTNEKPPAAAKSSLGEGLLVNINDAVELAYIKSALAEQDIPCRVLAEDVSQYLYILHGRSFMGINVYVPESAFDQACDVLASYKAALLPDEDPNLCCEAVLHESFRYDLLVLRVYLIINLILFLLTGVF